MKNCDPIKDVDSDLTGDDFVDVRCFKNEKELYKGFRNLVKEVDPDVIIGYNIFRFDIVYVEELLESREYVVENLIKEKKSGEDKAKRRETKRKRKRKGKRKRKKNIMKKKVCLIL